MKNWKFSKNWFQAIENLSEFISGIASDWTFLKSRMKLGFGLERSSWPGFRRFGPMGHFQIARYGVIKGGKNGMYLGPMKYIIRGKHLIPGCRYPRILAGRTSSVKAQFNNIPWNFLLKKTLNYLINFKLFSTLSDFPL